MRKAKKGGSFCNYVSFPNGKTIQLAVKADGLILAVLLTGYVTLAKTLPISVPQFQVSVQPRSKQTN